MPIIAKHMLGMSLKHSKGALLSGKVEVYGIGDHGFFLNSAKDLGIWDQGIGE